MSFAVAVQSAIFYFVSCAPCLQARHHQQSKALAKKEREEKARILAKNPGSYQHPDPFNTNPYWSEEIMMGPHIESKKYQSGSKNISQKRLNSSGKENSSIAASSSTRVNSTSPGSSHTVVVDDAKLSFSTTLSDDWNRKRYQREDEELWGHDQRSWTGHKLMDAIKHAGSSAGRLLEVGLGKEPKTITDEDRHNFYFAPRNPPVNDYHPPIVRQRPAHQNAHMWMLQPPPPAKIMEGKVPVSRTGSTASYVSRKTTTGDGANSRLSRLVHERAMEAKLRSGELPFDFESTSTLHKTIPKNTTSNRRRRSMSLESSDISDETPRRKSHRRRRSIIPDTDSSSEEDCYYLRSSDSFGRGRRVARRPTLQSISSSQESERDSQNVLARTGDATLTRSASLALANISSSTNSSPLKQASGVVAANDENPQQKGEVRTPSFTALGPVAELSS
ncbi:hypothetical protein GGS23DRAFT_82513 [Durotheca rogersii]|uniref:uncharacterized protein n=1 Tax=Durotheca rogersii TaxID=419775 RepID=UPI00222115A6|nr:uncharacterized protein GGS23DRAFT_82513 [Durotheca rogersii]KAI5862573.1 hypothetical protein GGS23DRAFT_82513 [Durotheca rogersii]